MDLAMVILTALAVLVSVIALYVSFKASQKGNELASVANDLTKTANDMQMAQVEMQIRELILSARSRYEDKVVQFKNDEDIEEVMRDKGLRLDDCYYMASESPIDIEEL